MSTPLPFVVNSGNDSSGSPSGESLVDRIQAAAYPEAKEPEAKEPEAKEPDVGAPKIEAGEEDGDAAEKAKAGQKKQEAKAEDDGEDDGVSLDVDDFAALLGVDPNALTVTEDGDVRIKTTVNGEVGEVSAQDLIKSYQTDAHVTKKSQALAEERRAFEQQAAAEREKMQKQIGDAAIAAKFLESQLTAEYNSVDWAGLRENNPTEWTIKRQEFQDKLSHLTNAKTRVAQILQAQAQESNAKREEARMNRLTKEAEALVSKLPEWSDPKVAGEQHKVLASFIHDTYGFEEGDLDHVEDHRLVLMARDAMKYRQQKAAAEEAVTKVRKLPRIQKPGAERGSGDDAATKQAKNRLIRLKKGGSTSDLAAVLLDRIS